MSTPDGYVVEGPVDDGEWTDWELLSAHRDRATAEAWIDDWPHWREAGARIRPFRYTEAPASGEPSGAEAAVREALDAIKKAHTAVDDLCSGNSWTMSIPARPDADHDLVIDDALTKAERVIRLLADIPTAPGAPEEGAGDAE